MVIIIIIKMIMLITKIMIMNKKQESITHSRLGIIVVFLFSFTCFICPMKHLREERISGSETQ